MVTIGLHLGDRGRENGLAEKGLSILVKDTLQGKVTLVLKLLDAVL